MNWPISSGVYSQESGPCEEAHTSPRRGLRTFGLGIPDSQELRGCSLRSMCIGVGERWKVVVPGSRYVCLLIP